MTLQRDGIYLLMLCALLSFPGLVRAKTIALELVYELPLDTTGDTDGDQLSDGIESSLFGTRTDLVDSDHDGLSDFDEVLRSGHPLSGTTKSQSRVLKLIASLNLDTTEDQDQDQLSDGFEKQLLGSDSSNPDTDGDLLTDFQEVLYGSNLFRGTKAHTETTLELVVALLVDTTEDEDKDGLSSGFESVWFGLNPVLPDSDQDGLSDFEEVLNRMNGLSDPAHFSSTTTLDLFAAFTLDTTGDADGDSLTDGAESGLFFTSITHADTDMDGLVDFRELILQGNPFYDLQKLRQRTLELLANFRLDTTVDRDQDGLSDGVEMYITFTDIHLVDTDGDDVPDDIEVLFGTNPYHHLEIPVSPRPVIRVGSVIDRKLLLTVEVASAKLIILEQTDQFDGWQVLQSVVIDDGPQEPISFLIPIDTGKSFFRIVTQE